MTFIETDADPDTNDTLMDNPLPRPETPEAPKPEMQTTPVNLEELKTAHIKAAETRNQWELERSLLHERMSRATAVNDLDELMRLTKQRQELQAALPTAHFAEAKAARAYHTGVISVMSAEATATYRAKAAVEAEIKRLQVEVEKLDLRHFNSVSESRVSRNALLSLDQDLRQFTASENKRAERKEQFNGFGSV